MHVRQIWIVVAPLLLAVACTSVAITGRSQLDLVSDRELAVAADRQFAALMDVFYQKNAVLSPTESSQASAVFQMVQRVADRVIDAAGVRRNYPWEMVVVKARAANAYALPNGKIVVYTGLLPVTQNEAALAAVIGHEVAHVVARHQAERLSQIVLAQLAITTADAVLAAKNSQYRPIVGAALGVGVTYGVFLPFSRAHESEADHLGLFYMAKAGYDPAEAVGLWERMEVQGGTGPWAFLNDHPSNAARREQIRQWLTEVAPYYADPARPLPSNLAEAQAAAVQLRASLGPEAARPSLQAGYWVRAQVSNRADPTTFRLGAKEPCAAGGECFNLISDDSTSRYTADYAWIETKRPDGTWIRFDPPLRLMQWPLRVGSSWSDSTEVASSSGTKQRLQYKGDVVAYEGVHVPAGSFMAFKIVLTLNGARFRELWWAPETRTPVRSVWYDDRGHAMTTTELVDYQKSREPAGKLEVASEIESPTRQDMDKGQQTASKDAVGPQTSHESPLAATVAPSSTNLRSEPTLSSRPSTGTILSRPNALRGQGELSVVNGLAMDAVVTLRTTNADASYITFYVRAGENAAITDIAQGEYELTYTLGENWADRRFTTPADNGRLNQRLTFADSSIVVRGPDGTTVRSIPGEPWKLVLRPNVSASKGAVKVERSEPAAKQ
jgi:Zn-dependent protease with chaperone function